MSRRDWTLALGLALAVAISSWLLLPSGGSDWVNGFGPAGRLWRSAPFGYAPYMPWAFLPLAALAALPDQLATALVNGAGVFAIVGVLRRYAAPAWLAVPLVLSPFALWLFKFGQTDLLILAGLLLPAGYDVVALVMKPQVAAGALVARLARRLGNHRRLLAYLAPLAVVGLVSLIIWPSWPLSYQSHGTAHAGADWNRSPWPWGIPLGLALLWRAWRRQDETAGILATPLLMPFIGLNTVSAYLVIVAARWPLWFLSGWLTTWAIVAWLAFGVIGSGPMLAYTGGLALGALAAVIADLMQRKKSGLVR